MDDKVRVVAGDNRTGYVARRDVAGALADGWRLGTEDEAAAAKVRREASGVVGTVQGSAEALASGASLGMSDVALDALGVENIGARREALGDAATALEIAGGVGATIATGGLGGAAQGAGRLGGGLTARTLARRGLGALAAPTKYATKAGHAVERAVLGARGAEATLARRGLASFAGSATEGVLGGVGGAVSESVIKDKPLTAEALVGGAIAGGLFEGSLGGGATAAGGMFGRMMRGVHPRSGKAIPADDLRRVIAEEAGIDPGVIPDSVVDGARKTDSTTLADIMERAAPYSGADPEIARRVGLEIQRDPQRVQKLLANRQAAENEIGEIFQGKLNAVQEALSDARKRAQSEGKYSSIAGKMPERLSASARSGIKADLKWWNQRAERMTATNEKTGFSSYDQPTLNKFNSLLLRAQEEMLEDHGSATAHFRALDRLKRDVAVLVEKTGGWGAPKGAPTSTSLQEINEELRDLHRDMRLRLENHTSWGAAVAQHQQDLNSSLARSLQLQADFTRVATNSGTRSLFNPDGKVNLRSAISMLRQHRRMGGSEVVRKFDQVLESQLDHLRVIRDQYDLGREELHSIQKAEDAVKGIREEMSRQADNASLLDDLQSLRDAESAGSVSMGIASTIGPSAGAIIGAGLAGPVGAGVGLLAGGVLRPYTTARSMASLLAMKRRFGGKFDGASLVGKLRKGYGKAVAKMGELGEAAGRAEVPRRAKTAARGLKLGLAFQIGRLTVEEKAEGLEKMGKRLRELEDPEQIEVALGPDFQAFAGDAPETAGAVHEAVTRLARFLRAEMPPVFRDELVGGAPFVNEPDADRWIRLAQAALDPRSVVDHFLDGTLTTEEARALQEVYPATFAELAAGAQEAVIKAAEQGEPIDYEGRVLLSVLLGMPLEPMLRPSMFAHLQGLYTNASDASEPQYQDPNGGKGQGQGRGRGPKTTGSIDAMATTGTASQRTGSRKSRA
ncbi:MAG: hypothetical protein KC501_41215 [Myxococcales bacterium]|nr:hypothetical protein [Myxococcales bacterium]